MKVVHILDTQNRGVAESKILDVCQNAKRFGIDLTFIDCANKPLFDEDAQEFNFEYLHIPREFTFDPYFIWQIRKILAERKIQIVQSFHPIEALHIFLATIRLKNIKCVLVHENFLEEKKFRFLTKFLSPKMNANISTSRSIFPWLRKEIGLDTSKNFYLIYSGVDENRFVFTDNLTKKELGFDDTTLLLGMKGNFRSDSDQITICRALPEVFEKNKKAKFIFLGKISVDGDENYEECISFCDENGIGEKVFFIENVHKFSKILTSLNLFVYSSLNENFSFSVAEAMFSKIPIIISDNPPLIEVTNNGKCAETFSKENAEELSEKILKLLNNQNLCKNLTDDAFEFALEHYSLVAHFRGLKTLYSDLIKDLEIEEIEITSKSDESIFKLD